MDDQKEIYRLWFEYLKRSDDYKGFCEWWGRDQEGPSFVPKNPKDPSGWVEAINRCMRGSDTYDTEEYTKIHEYGWHDIFKTFFDVHKVDFGLWWEWYSELEKRKKSQNRPVENYPFYSIREDFDYCIEQLKEDKGREPTAYELRDYFMGMLSGRTHSHMNFYLKVDLRQKPKDIKEAFNKTLKSPSTQERIAIWQDEQAWMETYHDFKPTGKPRVGDLQKYLDVYDLWKEKVLNRKPGDPSGWDEIMQHFEPGRTVDNDGDRRVYLRYKQIAEKIIANVEEGYFPGKY